jgi:MSHA biogenesis protein MshQ
VTGGSFNPSTATLSVTTGTLSITGNATVAGGSATNSGATMSVTTGTITIGTVPVPRTLTITAGTTVASTTTVSVSTGRITVTGNTTVTGGAAVGLNAVLTVTAAPAAGGNGININGDLTVASHAVTPTATTATVSSTAANSVINVAGNVTNGDRITINTGIFSATGTGKTFTTSNNAIVTATAVTTGTLAITGNAVVTGGTTTPSGATMSLTTGILTVGGNLDITAGTNTTTNATVSVTSGRIAVTGNATLTGSAAAGANRNALLTVTAAPAVGGNGININGDLTVASHAVTPTATTATVSSTAINSVINVAGDVINGDQITINTGIFSATGTGKTFTTSNNAMVTATAVTTGTLAITGNAVVTGGTTTPSGATMSLTTGILTVGGNLSITAGTNTTTNATVSVTSGRITVTGDATLTGSAASGVNRNALLTVAGASAVGNGINVNGSLNILPHGVTPTVTTATVSMTGVAGGRITVAGDVTNRDTVLADAGIFTVTGTSSTYDNNSSAIVANTRVTTGSLNLSGDTATLNNASGDTMSITSTGSITVGSIATNTGTLTNSGTITLTVGGTVNANGNFTNSGTFTNTAAGLLFLGGATSTINGTFNRGTGTVTMDGIAAQSLSGSALDLRNFTVNNTAALATRTVTLGNDLTVNNLLTFTSGRIVTGASKVILPSTALAVIGAAGTPDERFVAGNLQKFAAAGGPTVIFEIGSDGAAAPLLGYSPVTLVFSGVAVGGGSLIASVGLPVAEHPSVASSGVDSGNSVNRWWAFTTTGVTGTALPAFTSYTATATFLNPSDLDNPASTGSYEIERWDTGASTWNTTTVGTRTGTTTQASGITALGQLAIGVKALPPATGDLNAFETSTAGGAVTGRVFTKLVGTNFSIDVVAIVSGAQHATFNKTVELDLVTGAAGGLNCAGTPVTIAGTTQSVALTNGRGTTGNFNVASAFPNARVRIRYPVSSPTTTSCSTDNFSNRPTVFTVNSANATQTDSSGTPAIKTGASFNLTATMVTGYSGTPLVDNTAGMVVGTPNAGTLGGTFGAASGGTATGSAFTYSQVGNFGLSANAVYDTSFTTVDQAGGDCVASSFSNTLSSGKYGCSIGSTAVPLNVAPSGSGGTGFGRFIPDNFNISYSAVPEFTAGCGTFSYVGAPFFYGTAPQITVTARNSGGGTTTNYAGSYMKLTNSSLTPATQASRYSRFDAGSTPALDTTGLPATAADPAIGAFTVGVGTLTFDTGAGGLKFARSTTTPAAPFNADIALSINVIDADGVAAGSPAQFGTAAATLGITFSGTNNAMRYGRLRMPNALGSEKLDLPIQAEVQYWTGTGFSTNTLDGCTSLSVANFSFPSYAGGITSTNMNAANISPAVTISFTAGTSSLKLTKPLPTPATPGSTTLTVDLAAEAKTYLQGNWGLSTYTANPSARAAFGVYAAQPRNFIFFRENY